MNSDELSPAPPNNSRKQLILMLVIMVVTLGGSYLLFVLAQDKGVWSTVNKGEFVKPVRSVTEFDWRTKESAPFADEFPEAFSSTDATPSSQTNAARVSVKRTWWLLAVSDDQCASACEDALQHMRSLQILLTKDATRLRRALVLPGQISEQLSQRYPRLVQLAAPSVELPAGVYIVDPTGVLVLRYPLLDSASDIQKDLKRLLKYSQLG